MAGLEALDPTAPVLIGLDDMKRHLRVDDTVEDALIGGLIATAGLAAERYTRRVALTRGFRLWLDRWPSGRRAVTLPKVPLVAVEEVSVIDEDGGESPLAAADWLADTIAQPGRVMLRAGVPEPRAGRLLNGIAVRFQAGYGKSPQAVPEPIRHGVALLVGHLHENRAAVGIGVATLPWGVEALWAPYRLVQL